MLKPLNGRVILRPETERQTKFGLVLVEDEHPDVGFVVIGNDTVKEGDKVVFSKFGYDEVMVDGEKLYMVSESNILGVFI